MRDRFEVGRAIDKILIPYADCFAWEELGPQAVPAMIRTILLLLLKR